jgi:hypothetical protein
MLQNTISHHYARLGVLTLAASLCATIALAQPEPAETTPDPDNEAVFAEDFDFSLPPPTWSEITIDASKFTAGPAATSGWDAKAGLDYRAPATPNGAFRPDRILPGAPQDQASGVAWANITAPGLDSPWSWDKTQFESRIDPGQENRLGMTLSRSVPVGSNLAVTLQNGYAVTQTLTRGGMSSASGIITPYEPTAGGTSHVYETNQALRFSYLPMDTTFSVGGGISSADDKWLPSLSAEQKLFGGPVSVTGTVSEGAGGDFSKSLKAGFRRTW